MNQSEHGANAGRFSLKSLLSKTILGLLFGGMTGFLVGLVFAPVIVPLLLKASVFIINPAAILIGSVVLGFCALRGALTGAYLEFRTAKLEK